jgi:diacylglycerol kinase family enzyme
VGDDAELRRLVEVARRAGEPLPIVGLAGGDLCRTAGGRGDVGRMRSAEAVHLPVDVASVMIDGVQHWFVAHLVARGASWWSGRILAVMNAQWLGSWDVAPKSHPNDGLLDVLDSDLSWDDRLKARRRLASGTHVPHPGIRQQRVAEASFELERPLTVHLDGEQVAVARSLAVRLEPDALTCVV